MNKNSRHSPRRNATASRIALASSITLFLVLAGTGIAHAYWTTLSSSTVASSAGSIMVTQSGFANEAFAYSSNGLVKTAPLTLTNTGSIPAPTTLAVGLAAPGVLSAATTVTAWSVDLPTLCDSSTVSSASSITAILSTGISTSVTLAVRESRFFCVRFSVASVFAIANVGVSDIVRATVTATQGQWISSSTETAVQTVGDTTVPTVPLTLAATATTNSVSLSWSASTDNAAVTGYEIFRGGILLGTSTTLAYIDATVTKNTIYNYTVRARDAANNDSAQSIVATITTPIVDIGVKYKLFNSDTSMCIDAGLFTLISGQPLWFRACDQTRVQNWMFVVTANGYYEVYPSNATTLSWSVGAVNPTANGTALSATTYAGTTAQQWKPLLDTGSTTSIHFVNLGSAKCLTAPSVASLGVVQQQDCSGAGGQSFVYSVVP